MTVGRFYVLIWKKVSWRLLGEGISDISASRQEYATEIWREGDKWDTKTDYDDKDWDPENNNYKFTDHERLCIHIREVHRYLYAVRQEIDKVWTYYREKIGTKLQDSGRDER